MKKCLSSLLAAVWVMMSCTPAAYAEEEYDHVIENCYNYANHNWDQYATSDVYYNYDEFVDTMEDSAYAAFLMGTSELLADVSYDPDTEDYMQTLSTVLALADTQNGSDPAVQENYDHLKDPESYIGDFADLCLDSMDFYTGNYGSKLEQQVMTIAEFAVNTTETTTEMLQAMANMQQQVEDFVAYDQMLAYIEHHSEGELKEAAQLMRQNMEMLMDYNMMHAMELIGEGVWETEASIFSCIDEEFFDWVDDQQIKESLKSLHNFSSLKESFDLGAEGALLAGNLILNTENSAKRVNEMLALDEIADVMAEVVDELQYNYLVSYENGCADREMANEYMKMVRHLFDTRRRGEYCLYSLLMEDSGVLSGLFAGEDIEDWYYKLTEFINDKQWLLDMLAVDPEVLAIHYYQVFDGVASTWEEAAAYCESLGGHLATIGSQAENDHVYSLMKQAGYSSAYIGLTDQGTEGYWSWVNGEPVIYMNWHRGEPSNSYDVGEHYAMFYYEYRNSSWNDGYFNGPTVRGGTAFICEWDVDPDTFDTSTLVPQE